MKKLAIIALLIFMVTGCSNNAGDVNFTINGTIEGVKDSTKVYLKKSSIKEGVVAIDTAIILNNKFTIEGKQQIPEMHFLMVEGIRGNMSVMVEEGDIKIEAKKDSLRFARISGTPTNDDFSNFVDGTKVFRDEMNSLQEKYSIAAREKNETKINEVKDRVNEIRDEMKAYNFTFVQNNLNSFLSPMIFQQLMADPEADYAKLTELFNKIDPSVKTTEVAKDIEQKLNSINSVTIGKVAPNFTAKNPEGKDVSLNDIKGKVTIIDFWAAWCGPCRMENPNVVKIYEKYHSKGLEIIGVSLDKKEEDWKTAIEKDGLTWHQVSNLSHWNDEIAKAYGINSIPATFILDEEGKIIARDLRGEALELKIKELLQ